MSVADALEKVYVKINGTLTTINDVLTGKSVEAANTFYELPDRISMITGANEIIDGTVSVVTSTVKSISPYKFYQCKALHSISAPLVETVGEYAFYGCADLKEINLPSVSSVGAMAFSESGVTNIEFHNVISMDRYAYLNCAALETVILPSLRAVGSGVFYNCAKLKKVDLTEVSNISANSFAGCSSLNALIIRKNGMCSLSSTQAFDDSGITNGSGYIYVPHEYYYSYLSATNWTAFRRKIRPIESYPDITGYHQE